MGEGARLYGFELEWVYALVETVLIRAPLEKALVATFGLEAYNAVSIVRCARFGKWVSLILDGARRYL